MSGVSASELQAHEQKLVAALRQLLVDHGPQAAALFAALAARLRDAIT